MISNQKHEISHQQQTSSDILMDVFVCVKLIMTHERVLCTLYQSPPSGYLQKEIDNRRLNLGLHNHIPTTPEVLWREIENDNNKKKLVAGSVCVGPRYLLDVPNCHDEKVNTNVFKENKSQKLRRCKQIKGGRARQ